MRRCGSRPLLRVIIAVHEDDSVFTIQLRNGCTGMFINGLVKFEIKFRLWNVYKSYILIKINLHATLWKSSAVAADYIGSWGGHGFQVTTSKRLHWFIY